MTQAATTTGVLPEVLERGLADVVSAWGQWLAAWQDDGDSVRLADIDRIERRLRASVACVLAAGDDGRRRAWSLVDGDDPALAAAGLCVLLGEAASLDGQQLWQRLLAAAPPVREALADVLAVRCPHGWLDDWQAGFAAVTDPAARWSVGRILEAAGRPVLGEELTAALGDDTPAMRCQAWRVLVQRRQSQPMG